MPRSLDAIRDSLDELSAADFDKWSTGADGWERLASICDELEELDDSAAIAATLFVFIERLDGADIGSPGPTVHLLERLPGYERHLAESLRRRPSRLALWMANRILNLDRPDRQSWLQLLRSAADDPGLPEGVREEAREFLEYQTRQDQ